MIKSQFYQIITNFSLCIGACKCPVAPPPSGYTAEERPADWRNREAIITNFLHSNCSH